MKTPFAIGDRVNTYRYSGTKPKSGEVTLVTSEVEIQVRFDDVRDGCEFFHPKACRRLIKKPRRTAWFQQDRFGELRFVGFDRSFASEPTLGKAIQFREVQSEKSVYKPERGE